jgi:cytochrome b561
VYELVGEAHHWVGWAIIIVAAGHAATALFHQYVLHDDVLVRMLPGRAASAAQRWRRKPTSPALTWFKRTGC